MWHQMIGNRAAPAERYRHAVESQDLDSLATLNHPDVLLHAHVPNRGFPVVGSTTRQLHLLRLDDGRNVGQTPFRAGTWSHDPLERMAAEAPLVRR